MEMRGLPLLVQCLLSVVLPVVQHQALWFFNFFIDSLISALEGMFLSMSSSGVLLLNRGGLGGSSLLRRVLKYSVHLDSCSSSVVRV